MTNRKERSKALDISWDYFKLLAQQRVTHFNLFIIIICAFSAVIISNIHSDIVGNSIALLLSFFQIFLCFIFYKIDIRNKYLIKHTESTIKNIERTYGDTNNQIFLQEEYATLLLRENQKTKVLLFKQLSTSQLYKLFYVAVFITGTLESLFSSYFILQLIFCSR
jgi:hypothetical protein